jgi:beta-glucosidase
MSFQKTFGSLTLFLILVSGTIAQQVPRDPREDDAVRRAGDLLSKMTLEEKLLQLISYKPNGVPRLGIPNLEAGEALHGVVSKGCTVFPASIALGATWDTDLIGRIADVIGREGRAVGVGQVFAPMLGLARDPRWGRVEESYGEDPFHVARIAVAYICHLQGVGAERFGKGKLIATPKHFVADGEPWAGANGEDFEVSERVLREVFMQPFEAAVKEAKTGSIMPAHHALNGVPCHANVWLLDTVLRKEWGFRGFITSDMGDIPKVAGGHKYAKDARDAAVKCLRAGVDMELVGNLYMKDLKQALADGEISEDVVNQAVRRVLTEKIELLGLSVPLSSPLPEREVGTNSTKETINGYKGSDDVWAKMIEAGKFTTPENARCSDWEKVVANPAHDALALEAAEKSLVLLKNEHGLLPLKNKGLKRLLLVGSLAKDRNFGGYSNGSPRSSVTIHDGLKASLSEGVLSYEPGYDLKGDDESLLAKAVAAASSADTIIAVVGHTRGQVGENKDRDNLDLIGGQEKLLEAMQASGKPLVVVLANGAPLTINWMAGHVPAIIESWYGGQAAGTAVAKAIFGEINPGGKLPVTFPKNLGQIPCYYNHYPLTGPDEYYLSKLGVLFPFGFGLSYTTFGFRDLKFSAQEISKDRPATVTFTVTNTGDREGDEVVQLYLRQDLTSKVRPVLSLRGFRRLSLKSGESREVSFPISYDDYKFWRDDDWVSEPGTLKVLIGSSSTDLPLKGTLQIK